jgi:hypothetical protein
MLSTNKLYFYLRKYVDLNIVLSSVQDFCKSVNNIKTGVLGQISRYAKFFKINDILFEQKKPRTHSKLCECALIYRVQIKNDVCKGRSKRPSTLKT